MPRRLTRPVPTASAAALLGLSATAAEAYIGPGMAGGAIAAVLGVIAAFVLALVAVVYYPIKRLVTGAKPGTRATPEDRRGKRRQDG